MLLKQNYLGFVCEFKEEGKEKHGKYERKWKNLSIFLK